MPNLSINLGAFSGFAIAYSSAASEIFSFSPPETPFKRSPNLTLQTLSERNSSKDTTNSVSVIAFEIELRRVMLEWTPMGI